MKVLAIDSATSLLSVSLTQGEDEPPFSYQTVRDIGLKHSESLMRAVEEVLNQAGCTPGDIDLVACARGPGSFTGLRIGMATAKGLAMAVAEIRNLSEPPLVSVPTLDAIAAPLSPLRLVVLPVVDARKRRFYAALYRDGAALSEPLDLPPADIVAFAEQLDLSPGVVVTGPAAQMFAEATPDLECVVDRDCRRGWARWLGELACVRLAEFGYDSIDQGPEYLRGSEAEIARVRRLQQ